MTKKAKISGFIGVRVPRAAALKKDGTLKSGCRWEYYGDPRSSVKKRPICDVKIEASGVTCEKDSDGNTIRCWANKRYPGGTRQGHGFREPSKVTKKKPAKKARKKTSKKK